MTGNPTQSNSKGHSDRNDIRRSPSLAADPQESFGTSSPRNEDEETRFHDWYNALPFTENGGRALPKDWAEHWRGPHQPRWYDEIPPSRSPSLSRPSSEAGRPSPVDDAKQNARTSGQESKKRKAEEPEASRHDAKRRDTKAGRPAQRMYSHTSPEEPVIELPYALGQAKAQTAQEISPLDAIVGFASGVESNILGKELLETLVGEYADRKANARTAIVRDFMTKSQEKMYNDNVFLNEIECKSSYITLLKNVGSALEKINLFEKSSMTGIRFEGKFGNDSANDDLIVLPSIVSLAKANRTVNGYAQNVSERIAPSEPLPSMQNVDGLGYPEHYYEDGKLKSKPMADILKSRLNYMMGVIRKRIDDREGFLEKINTFEVETRVLEAGFAPANEDISRHNTESAIDEFYREVKWALFDVNEHEKDSLDQFKSHVKSTSKLDDRPRERGRS